MRKHCPGIAGGTLGCCRAGFQIQTDIQCSLLAKLVGSDAVLFHESLEILPRHFRFSRGLRHVSVMFAQNLADKLGFEQTKNVVTGFAEDVACNRQLHRRACPGNRRVEKVLGQDDLPFAEDYRPFDDVLQLTDISRVRTGLKHRHRFR